MTSPRRSRKAYLTGFYALKRAANYGPAEPVPFVRQSLPQPLRWCPNWPTEGSNLDRCGFAQDASPGLVLKGRLAPQGRRLRIGRYAILDNLPASLRDSIMLHDVPRTGVLG